MELRMVPELLLKVMGRNPKWVVPPLEVSEWIQLHDDDYEYAVIPYARDIPESVPGIRYATAGSFMGLLSEAALFFSSSRFIINLNSCISSSGGSVGGTACESVICVSPACSASPLDLDTSDSRSFRSFSFMPSFHA